MGRDDALREVLDRTRRIETRQAKYLASIGFETGARKPMWVDGRIEAPSPAVSLADCVAAIPEDHDPDAAVNVLFRGECIGWVVRPAWRDD